jgi:hypothetical protein
MLTFAHLTGNETLTGALSRLGQGLRGGMDADYFGRRRRPSHPKRC